MTSSKGKSALVFKKDYINLIYTHTFVIFACFFTIGVLEKTPIIVEAVYCGLLNSDLPCLLIIIRTCGLDRWRQELTHACDLLAAACRADGYVCRPSSDENNSLSLQTVQSWTVLSKCPRDNPHVLRLHRGEPPLTPLVGMNGRW